MESSTELEEDFQEYEDVEEGEEIMAAKISRAVLLLQRFVDWKTDTCCFKGAGWGVRSPPIALSPMGSC